MIRATLDEFFRTPWRSQWITYGKDLEVYLRKAQRLGMGIAKRDRLVRCLDIANVNAKTQGTGQFTNFIEEVSNKAFPNKFELVYVENVQEVRLQAFIERCGFVRIANPLDTEGIFACYSQTAKQLAELAGKNQDRTRPYRLVPGAVNGSGA